MSNYIFAIIASSIAVISFIPYFRDTKKGKTKPHIFSWILWTLTVGIVFLMQIAEGAGIGAMAAGVSTLLCTLICIISFKQGEFTIKTADYVSIALSSVALVMWLIIKVPEYSVILISISDFTAFIPTIRKSYTQPYSETISLYLLASVKHVFNLFALVQFTFVTAFFSLYTIVAYVGFVGVMLIRRRALAQYTGSREDKEIESENTLELGM